MIQSTIAQGDEEFALINYLVVHSTLRLSCQPPTVSSSRGKNHIFSKSCKCSKVLGSALYPVEYSVPSV